MRAIVDADRKRCVWTALWLKVARVTSGHDVTLNRFHGFRVGHSPGHDALKEVARGPVAVIAADAEDDGSFLFHRLIALGQRDDAGTGQGPGLGVALVDGVAVLAVAGAQVGDEGGISGHLEMAVDAVFHVQPGVGAAWVAVAHDIDRVHVAGLVVETVGLGVAEVKAALFIEIESRRDHVDALGLTVDRCLFRAVVAVAHAGGDGDAVDLVSADGQRESVGHGGNVITAGAGAVRCAARRRGREVVVIGRLVVEFGDGAGRVGAECVLRGGVGVAAVEETDVAVGLIRLARDLIERPGVGAVQGASGADGSDTGRRRGQQVARTSGDGLRRSDAGRKDREGEKNNDGRQDLLEQWL